MADEMDSLVDEVDEPATEVSENFWSAVEEFFNGGGDGGEMSLGDLIDTFSEVWGDIREGIRSAAGDLTQQIIDYLMYNDEADDQIGEFVGWLSGTITFEIILGLLTAGVANATTKLGKVLKYFVKILDWTGEVLGLAFKALGKVAGFALDMVKGVGRTLNNAGGAIGRVLGALQEIGEIIVGKVDELLGISARIGGGGFLDDIAAKYGDDVADLVARNGDVAEELLTKYGDDAAEAFAKYGDDAVDVLHKHGDEGFDMLQAIERGRPESFYTYKELKALVKDSGLSGRNVGFEAHHLLEKQFADTLDLDPDDIIAVPLTPKWHRNVGGMGVNIDHMVQNELKSLGLEDIKNAPIAEIWKAHRNVYERTGHPEWALAIYNAYFKNRGITYW